MRIVSHCTSMQSLGGYRMAPMSGYGYGEDDSDDEGADDTSPSRPAATDTVSDSTSSVLVHVIAIDQSVSLPCQSILWSMALSQLMLSSCRAAGSRNC